MTACWMERSACGWNIDENDPVWSMWDQKSCTLNREELVWHPPEKLQDERSSKQWKVTELPPSGSELVLDALICLMDEVAQLQETVHQHGKLLVARFEGIPRRLKEERIYLKWDLEEYN